MKLREYIKKLNQFVTDNPECLEMECIISIDDEGNDYNIVHYGPFKGFYDGEGGFYDKELFEDLFENGELDGGINAVCLN